MCKVTFRAISWRELTRHSWCFYSWRQLAQQSKSVDQENNAWTVYSQGVQDEHALELQNAMQDVKITVQELHNTLQEVKLTRWMSKRDMLRSLLAQVFRLWGVFCSDCKILRSQEDRWLLSTSFAALLREAWSSSQQRERGAAEQREQQNQELLKMLEQERLTAEALRRQLQSVTKALQKELQNKAE